MSSVRKAESPWRSGIEGARANLAPGLALQALALLMVLGFSFNPAFHGAMLRLVAVRESMGASFAILSTALCGGILPYAYIRLSAKGAPRYTGFQGALLTFFWAYKGFEVSLWYQLQAVLVGTDHHPSTVMLKVILDQFVYCPVFAVPVTTIVYQVVESAGRFGPLVADMRMGSWYARRVLPVLIANIGVWVPAVAIIYVLPTALQLPLQNLVLCFYTLVVAHQMKATPASSADPMPNAA